MTEDAHILVGFDSSAAGDTVVVVVRRDTGGPWQLERVDAPAQVDTSWIAEKIPAWTPPPWRPKPSATSLADELQERWNAAGRPALQLDDHQRETITAVYAHAIATGQICTPRARTR